MTTSTKFNRYIEKLGNEMGIKQNGNLDIKLNDKMEKKLIQQLKKNSFLNLINIIKTTRKQGDTLGFDLPIPSTADTASGIERSPERGYISPSQPFNCQQINVDSFLNYSKIDGLADYLDVDFETLLEQKLAQNLLFSMLMVGWNGTARANDSDSQANPLAQDVAQGWLQKLRIVRPAQIIEQAQMASQDKEKELNALVKTALQKIPEPARSAADLVAICGREVLAGYPIELLAADFDSLKTPLMTIAQKLIGGLKAINMPYFPANSILITPLSNLSLYLQSGTVRRLMQDNPSLDRLEDYISFSADFIVENPACAALIEQITIND